MSKKKTLAWSVLCLILSFFCMAGPATGVEIGAAAPSFQVESGDQQTISLEQLRGKVLLIIYETKDVVEENRPLKKDLTAFYARSEAARKHSLVLSVINCSSAYWPITNIWRSNLRKNSIKEGIVIYGDWDGRMFSDYGMRDGASNVVLVDSRGIVRYAAAGQLGPREIRQVERLLKELAGK